MSEQVENARALVENRNDLKMKLQGIDSRLVEAVSLLIDDDIPVEQDEIAIGLLEERGHTETRLEDIDRKLVEVLKHLIDDSEPLRLVGFHNGTEWTEPERTLDGKRTTAHMERWVNPEEPSEFPNNVILRFAGGKVYVAPYPVGREPQTYSPDEANTLESYVVPINNIVSISGADPQRAIELTTYQGEKT